MALGLYIISKYCSEKKTVGTFQPQMLPNCANFQLNRILNRLVNQFCLPVDGLCRFRQLLIMSQGLMGSRDPDSGLSGLN